MAQQKAFGGFDCTSPASAQPSWITEKPGYVPPAPAQVAPVPIDPGTAVEAANRGRAAMGVPLIPDEKTPAERTDIYQKSLQTLAGETLTPLN